MTALVAADPVDPQATLSGVEALARGWNEPAELVPARVCFLLGQKGPGLSEEARALYDKTLLSAKFGLTRSINASAAAPIAMPAWGPGHTDLGCDCTWPG